MFLVEKDSFVESNSTNLTNLMATGSISTLIDTDRHKFETFADALWWGIVSYHPLLLIKILFFILDHSLYSKREKEYFFDGFSFSQGWIWR